MSIASFARAVAHFVTQTLVCLLITAGIGALWALANSGGFVRAFHVALYVFGAVALALGALGVGGVSPSQGFVLGERTAGMIPGLKPATYVSPDGPL